MSKNHRKDKNLSSYFAPFLKEIKERGLSSSTLNEKERGLRRFKEWLYKEELSDIFPEQLEKKHLQKYRKKLKEKGLKEKTINSYLKTIYDLLEYLEDREVIPPLTHKEKETDIQKVVNHYFKTKGFSLEEIKKNAKKRRIIYSRYTKPAKDLLELTGSVEGAKNAIDKVAQWAKSRNLDYAIETVFKKWPEIEKLKPKEKKLKAYYRGDPMIWSDAKRKWYVIDGKTGDWLEFAGDEKEIQWKEE